MRTSGQDGKEDGRTVVDVAIIGAGAAGLAAAKALLIALPGITLQVWRWRQDAGLPRCPGVRSGLLRHGADLTGTGRDKQRSRHPLPTTRLPLASA